MTNLPNKYQLGFRLFRGEDLNAISNAANASNVASQTVQTSIATVGAGTLIFGLVGRVNVVMTKVVYGVYHGRFIEELLAHFDDRFSTATATAQKELQDQFRTAS